MTSKLWTHQERAVEAALSAMEDGKAGGLWVMPTGSGKTAAFVTFAKQLNRPTLIVVHRAELLLQTAREVARWWPSAEVGLLPGSGWESADVVIATVQTLNGRLSQISSDRFGLVVVDEAHHAVAGSWLSVLDHFAGAFRLGCTATPDRLDKQDIAPLFGGVIYRYTLAEAMEEGILVPVRQHGVFTEVIPVSDEVLPVRRGINSVSNPANTRLIVDAYLNLAKERPALFFAADLDHAEQITHELVRRGVRAATVTGEMDAEERRQILDDFREGRLQALVNCEVLTEGYDEVQVSCVVMARPTTSPTLYSQCVGRGMRTDPDAVKRDCLVIDIIDPAARKHYMVASDLFGARVADSQGEDIRTAADREKQRWQTHPVAASATLAADWEMGVETRWEVLPNLEHSVLPTTRETRPASKRQLNVLRRGYRLKVHRTLTFREAEHLIQQCTELEELYPTPATVAQEEYLRQKGLWDEGMTKHEARRRIARLHRSSRMR